MKLIKTLKHNNTIFALLLSSILLVSCNGYLDVDTDTDNPTIAPLNYLLTSTQVSLGKTTGFQDYSGDVLQVYTHQMTVKEEQDQYGTKVNNITVQNDWDNSYLTLTDIQSLINQSSESGDLIYLGIGQLEKAYLMSVAVDLWGDVPYTDATKLKGGTVAPKFDNQIEIYKSILTLIETAKTNLKTNTGLKPSADDLFYGGDTDKWIRFANTFKLKLYNQMRLSSEFDQTGFNALIAENNFFKSIDDDFQFLHTGNSSPSDERNPLYLESYNSSQFTTFMSPWFYEIMMGMNPNIHNGNKDPRLNYYFFKQLTAGQFPPDLGDTNTGNPKADYWDKTTGFFTIRFGSQGPWSSFSTENSNTYPGIFPCGGRYDDGNGGVADVDSGTGIAPHRILTYDEFLYIQAELIQAGKLTGNVTTKLQQAMQASFAKVDQVVANSGTKQTGIPKLVGSSNVTTFINKITAEFTAANSTKKLEIIMTQKWVATFGDPMDQYSDYRRTGFPILANPNSTSKEYQLNNGDGFPIDDSETVLKNPYQLSLYWPLSELNLNKNAPAQKNPATYKIFWDN
ncbi:SusD/RagB family nutrient-binding outer membrane lipoprotein [Flavobacterium sufflavum]|uniref:SusD/RagB family nutrient-binding outer membrane lipoprotein n=1 Tax=Flavobacterium sufflavum TaxID=1921138 RepID=A0A3S2U296_9FLAO|nr:SusD/RagB family nutrient-binding outer membrane lipoprotein [Flavobacterium sufflavum]RVT75789.1 SusD/RagB family nutrient-binding outer membrane lipoprotein [Flavobacterium sufflavum]